ncbi:hypothetical protein GOP47_0001360 [Adiantum capillus-veneris]|uniref:Uncharacterized protein n=1 Tax=Adiantum capillus-veneris TaxID=13818 RepID=A0A9D4V8Q5_ADICA|nr:hypothetical protein GOP47_0001360 [Adiantum capillus-veneris]
MEEEPRARTIVFAPPPPPPPPLPPQRGFGVGKTLLALGGGILLLILSRAQRDLRSLSGSIKEAVEESKAGLSLAERAVISMEEGVQISKCGVNLAEQAGTKGLKLHYNWVTGKGSAEIRGSYKKIYHFW